MTTPDPLGGLEARTRRATERRQLVVRELNKLGKRVAEVASKLGKVATSRTIDLEPDHPAGEHVGTLVATANGMSLMTKSMLDIADESRRGIPEDHQEWYSRDLADPASVPQEWFERATSKASVASLIARATADADQAAKAMDTTLSYVHAALESVQADVTERAQAMAVGRGETAIAARMAEARAAVTHDPARAITIAATMLETCCIRVLEASDRVVEKSDGLAKLGRDATACISVRWAKDDAWGELAAQVRGVCTRLGQVRNAAGDAHGRPSQRTPPTAELASFYVSVASSFAQLLLSSLDDPAGT